MQRLPRAQPRLTLPHGTQPGTVPCSCAALWQEGGPPNLPHLRRRLVIFSQRIHPRLRPERRPGGADAAGGQRGQTSFRLRSEKLSGRSKRPRRTPLLFHANKNQFTARLGLDWLRHGASQSSTLYPRPEQTTAETIRRTFAASPKGADCETALLRAAHLDCDLIGCLLLHALPHYQLSQKACTHQQQSRHDQERPKQKGRTVTYRIPEHPLVH